MYDRFTHRGRTTRGSIPRSMRETVYRRDDYTCQFCGQRFETSDLTIDHLIPLARGGLDEITNYVTCCKPCNQRKADTSLLQFARSINIAIADLPVHGDPIIDDPTLPLELRLLRKRIFDKVRAGKLKASGKQAQRKLERHYRSAFWETEIGQRLAREFPLLPGQVRAILPQIQSIATTQREFLLLVEMAKSANTRNLIGTVLVSGADMQQRLERLLAKTNDAALAKRLEQALTRFHKVARGLAPTESAQDADAGEA